MNDWNWEVEKPKLTQIRIRGVELTAGDPVRLWPREGADILDIALRGKSARVESIEQDFEDRIFVSVTVDDDPGQDLGAQGKPGHRFYFRPEEIEPLRDAGGRS